MIKSIERTKNGLDVLIDQTRDAVVNATDRAERGVGSAAESAVETSHEAGDYVREGAETASRGAHRRVAGAAIAIDRGYTRARSDLSRAAARTTDYLTDNPGKAMLFAASAGFVAGLLLRARRRSQA